MKTSDLLEVTLDNLFPLLMKLTNYEVENLPSLRKTIDPFSPYQTYDEVLDYFLLKSDEISLLEDFMKNYQNQYMDISYRLKTEQSLTRKWNLNLGKFKQIREVCNDVIGIRFILEGTINEIRAGIMNALKKVDYTIDMIDMHLKPKSVDDGYRAFHLNFRNQPRCFPVEIQIWTFKDAILHFYTHDVIYKSNPTSETIKYSQELRTVMDAIPNKPEEVKLSFETYLYKVLHANKGGEIN